MISRCSAEYNSPCPVAKPNNHGLRLVIDFRRMNSVTDILHVAMLDPRTALYCVRIILHRFDYYNYFVGVSTLLSGTLSRVFMNSILAFDEAKEFLAFETPIGTFDGGLCLWV